MNNAGQQIMFGGICRPGSPRRSATKAGAWPLARALATKMPLPAELGTAVIRHGINDIRLCHENGARFLKQF